MAKPKRGSLNRKKRAISAQGKRGKVAAKPASAPPAAKPQPIETRQEKTDKFFWAAIALVVIVGAGMLFLSFTGESEPVAPLMNARIPNQNPAVNPQVPAPVAPKVASTTYDGAHYLGNENADIILVEYSDFQCPFCSQAQPTLDRIRKDFPQVKHAFRHYPISIHPSAKKAAEAAECAGLQGKFWEMHDKLYANQNALSSDALKGYAAGLMLDQQQFDSCLDSGKTANTVAGQSAESSFLGMRATPSFLVFSKSGDNNETRKRAEGEAAVLAARYSQFQLPVAIAEVEGAGLGIVFAGALEYSDFAEVISVFSAKEGGKEE